MLLLISFTAQTARDYDREGNSTRPPSCIDINFCQQGMISEELENQHLERLSKRLQDANLANLKGRPSPAPEVSFQAKAGPWKHSESSTGSRQQFGNLQEYT